MKVREVAHHRNGISGEPFYVVTFENDGDEMVGIVFEEQSHVAVFDRKLLGKGAIGFVKNSWRGDHFEKDLRKVVTDYEDELAKTD